MEYLPVTYKEMRGLGWSKPDFVLVTGDVYVDHPSFGAAIIGRVLEAEGFRVAVLSQPDVNDPDAFAVFGKPKLGFLITAGNVDSMVAHYTVNKRRRSDDPMSLGNKAGARPDRAVSAYCLAARRAFPRTPLIIGGLEASLRRFAHYDYWDDAVRPSVLTETTADLLVYGMGERAVREIAARLRAGERIQTLRDIRGTAYLAKGEQPPLQNYVDCPAFEKVAADKEAFARATKLQFEEQDHVRGRALVQRHGEKFVVQNPPALPLTAEELDAVYELPYSYRCHPVFEKQGGVKALEEVQFSITHNRGCYGACNFCSIAFHQGRFVSARSHASVLREATRFISDKRFRGNIHDLGGPTANLRGPACKKQEEHGLCRDKRCLWPTVCPSLQADNSDYLQLLRDLRELPGVKRVFIRSGIRYDLVLADKKSDFIAELAAHHVSGQLRVAPEHCVPAVLDCMGKPPAALYDEFSKRFYEASRAAGREQYLLPYLISSHPGCTLGDAVTLSLWLHKRHLRPEQVQDFYPTPMTVATAMYHTGLDPLSGQSVYVPKSGKEKKMQRALLQWWKPDNRALVEQALQKAERPEAREILLSDGKNKPAGKDFGKSKAKEWPKSHAKPKPGGRTPAARPANAERAPQESRPTYGAKPAYGDKPAYSAKPAYGDKPAGGSRPAGRTKQKSGGARPTSRKRK